ncbi:MAG: hypothetical protein JW883_05285 [Deltaproteobacteria bacterium]|nr:hypothetical protein [Deltaproteobacteria bacterium]
MQEYNVIKTELTQKGIIVHKIAEGDELKTVHYSAVRCGLSWPSTEASGFYVILAEEYVDQTRFEGQKRPRGKLRFLKEREHPSVFLDKLFVNLTDDCALFHCGTVYSDLDVTREKDAEFYREWTYEKKIIHGKALEEAPYFDNFALGLSLIRRWVSDGLLELPEDSITRKQLKNITKADVDTLPPARVHAINALRFVVAAYHKYPPGPFMPYTPTRKKRPRTSTW